MEWSRLRTLICPAGDAGSNISRIRERCGRCHLCLYALEFGCATAWSNSLTGKKASSSAQRGRRQRQILYRGASTSTGTKTGSAVARCRRSFIGCFRLCQGARRRPPWPRNRTGDAYQLHRLHLAPARRCLQPNCPFHERLPRSRSMRVTQAVAERSPRPHRSGAVVHHCSNSG
jgi:hypothetical protein